ncbi:MAG: OB-fold nucleic acid binding domain-containing protein [Candidatus Nanohaloarchaea archaeon]
MRDAFRESLLLGVVGLALIYTSSIYIEPEKATVEEIRPSWIGKNVIVQGKVTESFRSNETLSMKINDSTGTIKVVQFDSEKAPKPGETVEADGVVKMYRGKMELVAEKIIRINVSDR